MSFYDRFVRNERHKEERQSFPLAQAFSCAWSGVLHALRTQRSMKIHAICALVVVVAGFIFQISGTEWLAVLLAIGGVLAFECLNTAVEAVVDLVTATYEPLAKIAKDCAAGAVLLMAIAAACVGLIVFVPRIVALITGAAGIS